MTSLALPRLRLRPMPTLANNHNSSNKNFRASIEHVPLDQLKPAQRQVRKHAPKVLGRLAKNIERFGCVLPILVGPDGVIVDGHAVWEACKLAKLETIPIVRHEHLTKEEAATLKLSLNSFAEKAVWDWDLVAADLAELQQADVDFDIGLTGFETAKIDWITAEAGNSIDGDDDEDVMPFGQAAVSRAGDLWIVGDHRIICGDATRHEIYESLLSGALSRV